jgi:outer membrane protein
MNKNRCLTLVVTCIAGLFLPSFVEGQDAQPIALKDAVNIAMRSSREVALAQARYDQAARTVDVNRSAFQPNLFTGSGAAYTYGFPQTPAGGPPTIFSLSYVQSMFNPVQTAQVHASQERKEVQRLEVEKTRNSVALRTGSAYLELGKVRSSLALMHSEQQGNARIITYTKERVSAGYELPTEADRAELAAAKTEQRIAKLESRESQLQQELAASMGLPPTQHIEVMTEPLAVQTSDREQDIVDRALLASLELKQSEYERRAKEHIVTGQDLTKWPTVDLIGQYGYYASYNNLQKYFQQFNPNSLTIGLQIKIPLISSQRSSSVALAKSDLAASEMELRNKRQNVVLEASRQYHQLRELDTSREVARLEHKLAQSNAQIIQANFQEGRANIRDVDRARSEENEKWIAFYDSDFEYNKAQLEILNTTGELSKIYQ